jgi:hypothetical protein
MTANARIVCAIPAVAWTVPVPAPIVPAVPVTVIMIAGTLKAAIIAAPGAVSQQQLMMKIIAAAAALPVLAGRPV